MMPTIEQQLVLHEGEELSAYPDAKGYTTIGVGQCIDARAGGQISQAASRFMLDEKLTDITNGLSSTYQWFAVLGAIRQKVCQDIAYNVGLHGFSGFVLMIHASRKATTRKRPRRFGTARLRRFDVNDWRR